MSTSPRVSEYAVNMRATAVALAQFHSLDRVGEVFDEGLPDFHIYMIATAPRVTADPSQFRTHEEFFELCFEVHEGAMRAPFASRTRHSARAGRIVALESRWPYSEMALLTETGPYVTGETALLASRLCPEILEKVWLEIRYVGQAFGDDGER